MTAFLGQYPLGVIGASLPNLMAPKYPYEPMAEGPLPFPFYVDVAAPPVEQKSKGSCLAQTTGKGVENAMWNEDGIEFQMSADFIYWGGRSRRGWQNQDSGMFMVDAIWTLKNMGVCSDAKMPYDPVVYDRPPTDVAFAEAARNKIAEGYQVPDVGTAKVALAAGDCVCICIPIHENFDETGETGIMPMPRGGQLGAHAVLAEGYDENGILCANWWSDSWGLKRPDKGWGGYFYIPEDVWRAVSFDGYAIDRFPTET